MLGNLDNEVIFKKVRLKVSIYFEIFYNLPCW